MLLLRNAVWRTVLVRETEGYSAQSDPEREVAASGPGGSRTSLPGRESWARGAMSIRWTRGNGSGRQGHAALNRVRGSLRSPMSRTVPFLLACVVVASCTPPVTTSESTSTSATVASSTTTTTLGAGESVVAFVDCLRTEGVPLDLQIGSDVPVDLAAVAAALDTSTPEVQAAIGACAPLLTTAQRADLAVDPEVRQLVSGQLEAFAACMRAEGVDGFPDPSNEAIPGFDPDAIPFADESFDAALEQCRSLVGSFGLDG